jgi:hypothetical protein
MEILKVVGVGSVTTWSTGPIDGEAKIHSVSLQAVAVVMAEVYLTLRNVEAGNNAPMRVWWNLFSGAQHNHIGTNPKAPVQSESSGPG